MKNIATLISALLLMTTLAFGQDFKKSSRLGISFFPQPETISDIDVDVNKGWVIPPIFFESERRFLKFFTFGSESTFGWYKVTSEDYQMDMNFYCVQTELQGKVSIPIAGWIEVYGQYGLGLHGQWIRSDVQSINNQYFIGSVSKTMSAGASLFLFDGFGIFTEAGILKLKSLNKIGDIVESSTGASYNHPSKDDYIESQSSFLKLGLVFSIN